MGQFISIFKSVWDSEKAYLNITTSLTTLPDIFYGVVKGKEIDDFNMYHIHI